MSIIERFLDTVMTQAVSENIEPAITKSRNTKLFCTFGSLSVLLIKNVKIQNFTIRAMDDIASIN